MDDLEVIGVIVVAMLVFFGGVFALAAWADSASCTAKAEVMGLRHSWGVFQDCMVKVGDDWIPLANYRGQQAIHK